MNIVILVLDPPIGRIVRQAMEVEGHTVASIPKAEEALRALEAHEGRSLLLIDNFHLSPAAQEALTRLAATPSLRLRIRVIGLASSNWLSEPEGALGAFIAMPFTVKMLLETIEAQRGEPDVVRPAAPDVAGNARDRRDGARCGGHGGNGRRTRRRSQRRRRRSRVRRSRKS